MSLQNQDLNAQVRAQMLVELHADNAGNSLYLSPRLNENGIKNWHGLLSEAVANHDDSWLATEIRNRGFLNSHETRQKPSGGTTSAAVPSNAHDTLAEGEFNRFYVRGLCLHAIQSGIAQVVVYRARQSSNPRAESEQLLGKSFSPTDLLNDLRNSIGVDTSLGLPPGPNSGLSVRTP